MPKTVFSVSVNGASFAPAEQSPDNHSWVTAVSRAHRKEQTFCMCVPSAPPKLIVKLYGSGTDGSHFGLARWPETGLEHHPDCVFFDEESEDTDIAGSRRSAFDDLGDGKIRVHLAASLNVAQASSVVTPKKSSHGDSPSKTQARAAEITLLQRLWRESSLNIYFGKKRNWFHATYAILNTAKRFIINKSGESLGDYLIVAASEKDNLANAHNERVLAIAAAKPRKLFALGLMRSSASSKDRILLPFKNFHGMPKILIEREAVSRFLHARPFYDALLRSPESSGNVVAFAVIEPNGKEWWQSVSFTGIAVTTNMIPVESSYECEMESYLAGQDRKFIKPMIVSEIDAKDMRPDFILLDTKPLTRIEVWGMQTPEYLEGKHRRIEQYARKKQKLLSWSASPREPLPKLPPAA